VINVISASRGETGLAFGNIVGACAVNIGLVLGLTALLRPLSVEPSIITREIPMLMVSATAMLVLSADRLLGGSGPDALSRADGLILLLLFGIFLYYTVIYSMAREALGLIDRQAFVEEAPSARADRQLGRHGVLTALGFAGVAMGADWTVDGATRLATLAGIPESVVGLTIVSWGTTLPELVTCVTAARRGKADIAMGNVVGSNLFNLLAIGGLVAAVSPIAVPRGGHMDLVAVAVLTAVLLPIAIRSGRTITRGEGAVLLAAYLVYLGYRLVTMGSAG
jgi:cation:H+ antiporter